jgi:hypothetical protein
MHSGDKVKKTEMSRARCMYVEKRDAYRILVRKPEGRIPLVRSRSG